MDYFRKDDFFELNKKYFDKILRDGKDYLYPSGFLNASTRAIEKLHDITINKYDFVEYRNDSTSNTSEYKTIINKLFNHWDAYNYTVDELTICHSVTVGSIAILNYLYSCNIRNVIFETPAYYATMMQAEQMGLNVIKIPSYYDSNFCSPLQIQKDQPLAYWITQPRISLGANQDAAYIERIVNSLRDIDYLIIDEATEIIFPSHLAYTSSYKTKNIIKIRSIFKGVGLNGARIATIIHPASIKKRLSLSLWVYQGGLDIFSLELMRQTCRPNYFRTMLDVSLSQVLETKKILNRHLMGSNIELSDIQNGYIGTLIFNYRNEKNYRKNRNLLLSLLSNNRIVVTLGASMSFAFDKKREFIRLNYYMNREHLVRTVNIMKTFEQYF